MWKEWCFRTSADHSTPLRECCKPSESWFQTNRGPSRSTVTFTHSSLTMTCLPSNLLPVIHWWWRKRGARTFHQSMMMPRTGGSFWAGVAENTACLLQHWVYTSLLGHNKWLQLFICSCTYFSLSGPVFKLGATFLYSQLARVLV